MLRNCRILTDLHQAGAWNMAVDDSLLESAATRGEATLRFYTWSEPTLTLGYFQKHADRAEHSASQSCRCLRRMTGGGAILHDDELTYSLTLPVPRHERESQRYYHLVHDALRDALAPHGIMVSRYPFTENLSPRAAFLCFQRRSAGDVVWGQSKILGSAQRRVGTALLQHGSLLLGRSAAAPELPGLRDLIPARQLPTQEQLIREWTHAICLRLDRQPYPGELDQSERAAAAATVESRFGLTEWTQRR